MKGREQGCFPVFLCAFLFIRVFVVRKLRPLHLIGDLRQVDKRAPFDPVDCC